MLCDLPGVGTEVASQLLVTVGDNPDRMGNEAQFASLVGVAPIPASSGKTTRHRLSRGGDRNANNALHQVVLVRMASCQRTKDYVAKRTAEGKSKREIMRCLKRYAAREIYRQITNPQPAPDNTDLRHMRTKLGRHHHDRSRRTWPMALHHFASWNAGFIRNDELAAIYRQWLMACQPDGQERRGRARPAMVRDPQKVRTEGEVRAPENFRTDKRHGEGCTTAQIQLASTVSQESSPSPGVSESP